MGWNKGLFGMMAVGLVGAVGAVLLVADAPLVAAGFTALFFVSAFALTKEAVKLLKGEEVLIMGPLASGKTTLAEFMSNGKVYDQYRETKRIEQYKVGGNILDMKNLGFHIDEISDTIGTLYSDVLNSQATYLELEEQKYSYLLYLFDVYKVYKQNESYIQDIEGDMEFIEEKVKGKKVLLIGTHEDLIKKEIRNYDREEITKKISEYPIIPKSFFAIKKNNLTAGLIIGSLKEETTRGELVNIILHAMAELKKTNS